MFVSYNNIMTLQFNIINVLPVATVEGLNEAYNIGLYYFHIGSDCYFSHQHV